jgi:transcription-repair coupling factor (superfamily II helicase)
MREAELEKVIVDFWNKRFDVLVCTTIIETGLDIANANTLIVDRAERMGLAQLHQLRGRVGRGRERAYAYFLYPPDPPLTETAHDRLATIASQSELGAGMAVAMKDLEIRGAGNLLGGEQSGHIQGVGFDLYLRMVAEAVADVRGTPDPEPTEISIELPVDAHIPPEYIDADRLRLEAYTKLSNAADAQRLTAIREELIDRYGPIPAQVEALFHVAHLRIVARTAAITDITAQGRYVRFHPVELPESRTLRLKRVHPGSILKPATRTVLVPLPREAKLGGGSLRDTDVVAWASRLIEDILANPEKLHP